jgi:hypothetical protein
MKPIIKMQRVMPGWLPPACCLTNCKELDQPDLGTSLATTGTPANNTKLNLNNRGINTFAGSDVHRYAGDGKQAGKALLNNPSNVDAGKRGDSYTTAFDNHMLRNGVGKTGIISTVAGNGRSGFSGHGDPATQAGFRYTFPTATGNGANVLAVFNRLGIAQTIAKQQRLSNI